MSPETAAPPFCNGLARLDPFDCKVIRRTETV